MLMQLLGAIDVIIGINFIAMGFGFYLKSLMIIFSIYLVGKGIMFFGDFASITDMIMGIVLIIGYFAHLPIIIVIICALMLLQKAFFSFIG